MIIDPNHLMHTIRIADNTPKQIRWIVRMLKGMIMWNDLDLVKDRDKMVDWFTDWFNQHSPQHMLWGSTINKMEVAGLYTQAYSWIKEVEQ